MPLPRVVSTSNEGALSFGTAFHTVDVLSDGEIRQGIKEYGNWPTIPQLYVNKKLVGGSDIMMEMYQAGELQSLIKKV